MGKNKKKGNKQTGDAAPIRPVGLSFNLVSSKGGNKKAKVVEASKPQSAQAAAVAEGGGAAVAAALADSNSNRQSNSQRNKKDKSRIADSKDDGHEHVKQQVQGGDKIECRDVPTDAQHLTIPPNDHLSEQIDCNDAHNSVWFKKPQAAMVQQDLPADRNGEPVADNWEDEANVSEVNAASSSAHDPNMSESSCATNKSKECHDLPSRDDDRTQEHRGSYGTTGSKQDRRRNRDGPKSGDNQTWSRSANPYQASESSCATSKIGQHRGAPLANKREENQRSYAESTSSLSGRGMLHGNLSQNVQGSYNHNSYGSNRRNAKSDYYADGRQSTYVSKDNSSMEISTWDTNLKPNMASSSGQDELQDSWGDESSPRGKEQCRRSDGSAGNRSDKGSPYGSSSRDDRRSDSRDSSRKSFETSSKADQSNADNRGRNKGYVKKPSSDSRWQDNNNGRRDRSHDGKSDGTWRTSGGSRGSKESRDSWGANTNYSGHNSSDKEFSEYWKFYKSCAEESFERVKEIQEDLFNMPTEYALAHCVAEDMAMGSGIAVQFSQQFKRRDELYNQREKQGGLATLTVDKGRYIYYLVTKKVSNGKPTLHTMWSSLKRLQKHMEENKVSKLAIPRIGCGLDRLEWAQVKAMLEYLFRNTDIEITVCNFQQAEAESSTTVRKPQKKCPVKNVAIPLVQIEGGTAIVYFGTEDGCVSEEIQSLDTKFNIVTDYKKAKRVVGDIIISYKNNYDYGLYGFIVKKSKDDPFDFINLNKCITAFKKSNKENPYYYVAIEAFLDEDELILSKIVNVLRFALFNMEVYVCWPGKMVPYMPRERRDDY